MLYSLLHLQLVSRSLPFFPVISCYFWTAGTAPDRKAPVCLCLCLQSYGWLFVWRDSACVPLFCLRRRSRSCVAIDTAFPPFLRTIGAFHVVT